MRAEVAAQATAERTQSFVKRVRVLLTPGTKIEYERVETSLIGPFSGYENGSILTLANGQRWRVTDGSFWSPKSKANLPRKVVIEPGGFGGFSS